MLFLFIIILLLQLSAMLSLLPSTWTGLGLLYCAFDYESRWKSQCSESHHLKAFLSSLIRLVLRSLRILFQMRAFCVCFIVWINQNLETKSYFKTEVWWQLKMHSNGFWNWWMHVICLQFGFILATYFSSEAFFVRFFVILQPSIMFWSAIHSALCSQTTKRVLAQRASAALCNPCLFL